MSRYVLRLIAVLLSGALLMGSNCSSSNDSTSGSTTTNASATGLWSGIDSVSGLGITGMVNAAGVATFIRGDGVQFTGTVQVSGNTLAMAVDGYSNFNGAAFSDGSTYGIGTLNGTVTSASALTATLTFTTTGNTAISGSWSLSYGTLSNTGSSTAMISGNYNDSATGTIVSITSSGEMTSQNPANSCVLNGTMSTSDATHDIYEVSYSYGDCTGAYAVLNGVELRGLATFNPNASPVQLTIAVTGSSSAGKYGIVSTLTGS